MTQTNKVLNADSRRQRSKALQAWSGPSNPVCQGEWRHPRRIMLVKQTKWDNEAWHLSQTKGGVLREGEPCTIMNCLREARLCLKKEYSVDNGDLEDEGVWILAVGGQKAATEAVKEELPGHTYSEWLHSARDRVLATGLLAELISAQRALARWPERADTGAYKFVGAKAVIRARARYGEGDTFRSGLNTRVQPPVALLHTFVVFCLRTDKVKADPRLVKHIQGKSRASSSLRLPLLLTPKHELWKSALRSMRAAWKVAHDSG